MKDGNKEKRTWMFFQSRSLFIRENHYVRITLEGNKLRLGFDDGSYKETDGVVEMDANDVLECYCSSCYTWYQFLAMAGFVFMAAAAWHLLNEPSGWRRGPDEAFWLVPTIVACVFGAFYVVMGRRRLVLKTKKETVEAVFFDGIPFTKHSVKNFVRCLKEQNPNCQMQI